MDVSTKQQLMDQVIALLREKQEVLEASARAAHDAATHEESLQEDKHDTRGLEASYLAGAQAKRSAEIRKLIGLYEQIPLKAFGEEDVLSAGAYVELEPEEGERLSCFLIPAGQGEKVEFGDRLIQLVTPASPIGQELFGSELDDELFVELKPRPKTFTVAFVS